MESLEKRLLRGDAFQTVSHIERDGLEKLYGLLLQGRTGIEYEPSIIFNNKTDSIDEREILENRRRQLELAMNRLKALYLYGEEETSQKDFIIERERIGKELAETESKLSRLDSSNGNGIISNEKFVQKASYFIMIEKMLDNRYIDYEKYIRQIDPSVPRNFLQSVVNKIEIDNGKVMSILFKNGIQHKFIYVE